MARTVFDNMQCAHIWAQQTQDYGRSHNGNLYFEGPTIYSYGKHFPVAHIVDSETVIHNMDSYSISTSQHQHRAYVATWHYSKRLYLPCEALINFILLQEQGFYTRDSSNALKNAIEREIFNETTKLLKSAAKRRKASLKNADLNSAYQLIVHTRIALEKLGLPLCDDLGRKAQRIKSQSDELLSGYENEIKQERKREKQRRKEQERNRKINIGNAIRQFREGRHYDRMLLMDQPVMLRTNGDYIETSHGAQFPRFEAENAFRLIKYCRNTGAAFNRHVDTSQPVKMYKLGHFYIDRVDSEGNVKAGCHEVRWYEIERLAKQLGLIENGENQLCENRQ